VIRSVNGKTPLVAESAFVSEAAYVVGDVEIGENCGIWPGAVVRGDFGRIRIGRNSSVEDNCVIHSGSPGGDGNVDIGEDVIIGHGATLNCRSVGDRALIGMSATVLHDVEIGEDSVIAAGSVVSPGTKIPPGSQVVGIPGKVKGRVSEKYLEALRWGIKVCVDLARQFKEQGL